MPADEQESSRLRKGTKLVNRHTRRRWQEMFLHAYVQRQLGTAQKATCACATCKVQLCKHKRCAACPVHKRRADNRVAEVHDVTCELLPDARIVSEFPRMSVNGDKGCAHCTGMFVKRPDFWADLVVQPGRQQWLGIQSCGSEHEHDKSKLKRDAAKTCAAAAVYLPSLELWLEDGHLDMTQWRAQLKRTLQWL